MKKHLQLRKLTVALVAAFAVNGAALALEETEPNGTLAEAMPLTIGADGTASVNGVVGTNFGVAVQDVDFYRFEANAGDMVTIMINNGWALTATSEKENDTTLTLLDANGNKLTENDDPPSINPGSTDMRDARIVFSVPVTGTYIVGVTGVGLDIFPGGTYMPTAKPENGDYTLIISGISVAAPAPAPQPAPGPVTEPAPSPAPEPAPGPVAEPVPPAPAPTVPAVMTIAIDIEPGERHNTVRDNRGSDVSVALLSGNGFHAVRDTDIRSLRFGVTGEEFSLKRCERRGERVDRNRSPDLVCHFWTKRSGFAAGSVQAVLRGKTRSGKAFEGRGQLKVVQHDRGRRHNDDDRRGR